MKLFKETFSIKQSGTKKPKLHFINLTYTIFIENLNLLSNIMWNINFLNNNLV